MGRIYLPIYELIIDLHEGILEISGGRPGIRDESAVHAAVARPKTYLSYHPECDIHTVCAVLLDSVARNHAFVEGNKRTGLLTAIVTYELNGVVLKRSADRHKEFENLVIWVVLEKPSIEEIAAKLKKLVGKYREGKVSRFITLLKSTLIPFDH